MLTFIHTSCLIPYFWAEFKYLLNPSFSSVAIVTASNSEKTIDFIIKLKPWIIHQCAQKYSEVNLWRIHILHATNKESIQEHGCFCFQIYSIKTRNSERLCGLCSCPLFTLNPGYATVISCYLSIQDFIAEFFWFFLGITLAKVNTNKIYNNLLYRHLFHKQNFP